MKKFFLNLTKFERFLLIFSLIFLIFSRFYKLAEIPVSLTHDETVYAIQAKSFAVQGLSTSQKIRPWSLDLLHHMYAEWPATIMIPGFLLAKNPILASHLLTAFLGLLIPIAFAAILHALWDDKKLIIAGLMVATMNPLLWQFSRLTYDAIFSLAFYFIGAAFYLNLKNKWKFLSIPIFILGFFQYQGMKLLLIPWVFLIIFLEFFKDKTYKNWKDFWSDLFSIWKKPAFFLLLFSLLLTIFYAFLILPGQDVGGRLSSTILTDNDFLSPLVNTQRRLSLISPANRFLSNKLSVSLGFIINNLFSIFSPFLLFVQGETSSSAFAVWSHGLFYLVDFVLIIMGISLVFFKKKNRLQGLLLLVFSIILSLPALINTMSKWYLLRSMLAYSIFLFFISFSFAYLLRKKLWKWIFLGIYAVSVLGFIYQFLYRYPVYSADAAEVQERLIARYTALLTEKDREQQLIVYTNEPERYFAGYLLYRGLMTDENKDQIALAYNSESYSLDNVKFTNDCIDFEEEAVLIGDILHSRCQLRGESSQVERDKFEKYIKANEGQALSIASVLDSGEIMRIYNDNLCNDFNLNPYLRIDELRDFSVEKMSVEQFCQTWITDLRSLRD